MNLLRRILQSLFGTWSWTPPPWLHTTRSRLARLGSWASAHRRAVAAGLVALVALGLGAQRVRQWWLSRPRPVELTLSATAPGATALEENARPQELRIRISGSAAKLEQLGKVVTQGITLSPAVPGEWRWANDRELAFTVAPGSDWAVGEDYTVTLQKTLFPEHVHLATDTVRFKSAPFTAQLKSIEFYQDPQDPRVRRVEATLAFSHPVNAAELPRHLTLTLHPPKGESVAYPFTLTYDKAKGEGYLHSSEVAIPAEDASMELVLSPGLHAARGGPPTTAGATRRVAIPGMYNYFRVASAQPLLVPNARAEPEQVLVVTTSTGITDQELQQHLGVWLLPRDLPERPDQPAQKNWRWTSLSPDAVDDGWLLTKVPLEPLPSDREYATTHSFRYHLPVGAFALVKVTQGARSFGGYVLAKDFKRIFEVSPYPREVTILHEGALLSLAGEKQLSVLARDVEGLQFEVGRVLPEQVNNLVTQTRGSFNNPEFVGSEFGAENITERFTETRALEKLAPGKAQFAAFDFAPYLAKGGASGRRGLFFFRASSWDPRQQRTTGTTATRFVLVTDLGLLVKDNADQTHDLFVQTLSSGQPAAEVVVQVLGRNGLPVVSGTTDAEGHLQLPKLTDFTRERAPVAYVARKGEDFSFIPYERSDRQLDFSRFEVDGVFTGNAERLSAFLFSDRGLYRPGDTFHVGAIVKPSDWTQPIAGAPLEAVVTDARGLEVQKQKLSLSAAGFEDIHYQTEETSPTGSYTVSLYVVKDGNRSTLLGSTTVRVEEFLPDRMKITTHFSTERFEGWVSPKELQARVSLANLFGTPAEHRRVTAQLALGVAYPSFRAYPEHHFFDPLRAKHTFDERLPDATTDEKGEASFDLGLERFEKATYQLSFTAEGFEAEGGRGVSAQSTVLVSPLAHLVGFKADGELRYLSKDSKRQVELIAIDPALQKVALPGLKARLIEQRYLSVLTQQRNGTYRYESVRRELPVSTKDLAIPAQGLAYALPTAQPGDFALIVQDADDTELARVEFSVAGKANLSRALEKNAELEIKLARTDYAPGDQIELQIKAPYTGAGLITIERDRIYAWKWFTTSTTSSVQTIQLPPGLEGNGYVNVSFVRALDSQEIFMSPLSYGVVPFSISRQSRTNAVTLSAPDQARPGEPFRIRYKGQKPGKAVIFAVDEGILQVAGYKTPDPLGSFFKKRALEVHTSQILDQLLPELSVSRAVSAAGGDAESAVGKNLNPFKRKRDKPVAYWSGIVELDTTEREVVYEVPDSFHGSLRVMAVAVSPDAVGMGSRSAIIRGPFVLSPNAPTFVAPGDAFQVSVSASNGVEGSGKAQVALSLETSPQLEVLDGATRTVEIAEGHEGVATFQVRAKAQPGSARLTFGAALGAKRSRQTVELSVRPAVPYLTTLTGGVVKDGSATVKVPRTLYPELRTLQASASPLPLGLSRGLMTYLDSFPYGCTEQVVSRAFPAVVLRHRPELGDAPDKVEANLAQTIRILRSRQNAEGAFGFWAANSTVVPFQTVYAAHFLTEAKEQGETVPLDLLGRAIGYLKSTTDNEIGNLDEGRTRAYALYVLTRNGVLTTASASALQGQLEENAPGWKSDLAAAYLAATYKLLKKDREANRLIDGLQLGAPQVPDFHVGYNGAVYDAQLLYLLARHFPDRVRNLPEAALSALSTNLFTSFNTLSAAYAVLGFDAYAEALGPSASARGLGLSLAQLDAAGNSTPVPVPQGLFPKIPFADTARALRFTSKDQTPLFFQATQAGFDAELPSAPITQKLEVQREYRGLDGKTVSEAQAGSELEVHLKLRALGAEPLAQLAIVDLLPGGFEVVMDKPQAEPAPPQPSGDGDADGDGEHPATEQGAAYVPPIGAQGSSFHPEYVDVREDRVVLFGTATSEVQEFVYRIKATSTGSFVVPPAFAESMYDRSVLARGVAAKMVVAKP